MNFKKSTYEAPRFIFGTRTRAEEFVIAALDQLDLYGVISAADMLDLADKWPGSDDYDYGWTSLKNAHIVRAEKQNGYEIILPRPILIEPYRSHNKPIPKETETMKRDPFSMANKFSRSSNVHMTIDGETFPVKIKNISCDSSDPFDSTSILTVEVGGHYHIPYYMIGRNQTHNPEIKRVIFNNPATIVFWSDGTKTVVKCDERDEYDPEKGLAMAIAKKSLGNNYNYYETFEKFIPGDYVTKETVGDLFSGLRDEALTIADKLKEESNKQRHDLVRKAYEILKANREFNEFTDIDKLIDCLGEALGIRKEK